MGKLMRSAARVASLAERASHLADQAAALERSSGKTGAQRLSSVEKGPVAGSLDTYLTPSRMRLC